MGKGGNDDIKNLALACRGCNSRKAIRIFVFDKVSKQNIPLFNPRKDSWKNHFNWSDNFLEIIGSTTTGKVTVNALQLNRVGVVNLRRLMILGKIHPPLDAI